ncbi:MAG TPA: polysaccharide pyruvyl transferase CsaB, partial [Oceanithermus sp.]|nr:polysaccharide pyruvyl transferase CsaB [Oceanithermus sp.]
MVVGIGGYYGYRNAGDEAILLAMAREIRARGLEALVLSASPQETAETLGVEA